jgi:hypothetical protein
MAASLDQQENSKNPKTSGATSTSQQARKTPLEQYVWDYRPRLGECTCQPNTSPEVINTRDDICLRCQYVIQDVQEYVYTHDKDEGMPTEPREQVYNTVGSAVMRWMLPIMNEYDSRAKRTKQSSWDGLKEREQVQPHLLRTYAAIVRPKSSFITVHYHDKQTYNQCDFKRCNSLTSTGLNMNILEQLDQIILSEGADIPAEKDYEVEVDFDEVLRIINLEIAHQDFEDHMVEWGISEQGTGLDGEPQHLARHNQQLTVSHCNLRPLELEDQRTPNTEQGTMKELDGRITDDEQKDGLNGEPQHLARHNHQLAVSHCNLRPLELEDHWTPHIQQEVQKQGYEAPKKKRRRRSKRKQKKKKWKT